jgi:hypothetical protein
MKWIITIALALVAIATPASAFDARVKATITRPAWFHDTSGGPCDVPDACLRDREMGSTSTLVQVPASFQKVQFYQPGPFGPRACDPYVYTDAQGQIDSVVDCPDQPPVLMEVRGESAHNFFVGTFDEDGFWLRASLVLGPAITVIGPMALATGDLLGAAVFFGFSPQLVFEALFAPPEPFTWLFPGATVPGYIDFGGPTGRVSLGSTRGDTASNAAWAAALMERLDFAYRGLGIALDANPARPLLVPPSQWTINNPFFGAPTTVWNSVHVNQGGGWTQAMRSVEHEMAHVLYNFLHSGEAHYWGEALDYAKNHQDCGMNFGQPFAQYEGFAEAISDIVWASHEVGWRGGTGAAGPLTRYPVPARNCALRNPPWPVGLEYEGNVADFYAMMVHGLDDELAQPMTGDFRLSRAGADWSYLLPVHTLFDMVLLAGADSHTASQMWGRHLQQACQQPSPDPSMFGPVFCDTERFRCHVKQYLASIGQLPSSFWADDCRPNPSSVDHLYQTSATLSTTINYVFYTKSEYFDEYRVRVGLSANDPNPAEYGPSRALFIPDVSLTRCEENYIRVVTSKDGDEVLGPPHVLVPPGVAGRCFNNIIPGPVALADQDLDLWPDVADNCTDVANPSQRDSDADDSGNACDCDFDQDGACTIADFNAFLVDFQSSVDGGTGTDMEADGSVGIGDFNLFLPGFQAGVPGP